MNIHHGCRRPIWTSWLAVVVATMILIPACHASCFFTAWNGASTNGWFGPKNGAAADNFSRDPPSNVHLLILPGFGNEAFDYTKEGSMFESLRNRKWSKQQIHVVPLNRFDWLLVFVKGLLDDEFRQGQADPTRPAFQWYLNRVANEIDKIIQQEDSDEAEEQPRQIILLGHSAGGWLGRAALGFYGLDNDDDDNEQADDNSSKSSATLPTIPLDRILGIVTLGAPNQPPPPGVMDMTQGALKATCQLFPSASYFTNRNIFYLTVIGDAIEGEFQERKSFLEPSTPKGFAYESYRTVCGTGETVGDGVVPTCSAHVADAVQINLDGVYHSINEPKRWYGADAIIDQWHDTMLQLLNKRTRQQQQLQLSEKIKDKSFTELFSGDLLAAFKK